MPQFPTAQFGLIDCREDSIFVFPNGLPAFEDQRQFTLLDLEETAPVVFLQSLQRQDLAFITLPAQLIEPEYDLALSDEDCQQLQFDPQESTAADLLVLAIVTIAADRTATANLMAPVVVHPAAQRAIQYIRTDGRHRPDHPLKPREETC